MAVERISLDSNLLVYSIDRDAEDRHQKAVELMDQCTGLDCVLPLQVLAEFFFVATRKGKMPEEDAAAQVADWQVLFPTLVPTPRTLDRAIRGARNHTLQFWDAMIWAVAAENRVTLIFSEDFQSGRTVEGVRFCNPFDSAIAEDPLGFTPVT